MNSDHSIIFIICKTWLCLRIERSVMSLHVHECQNRCYAVLSTHLRNFMRKFSLLNRARHSLFRWHQAFHFVLFFSVSCLHFRLLRIIFCDLKHSRIINANVNCDWTRLRLTAIWPSSVLSLFRRQKPFQKLIQSIKWNEMNIAKSNQIKIRNCQKFGKKSPKLRLSFGNFHWISYFC